MNKMSSPMRFQIYFYLLTLHTTLLVASNAGGAKMIALPGGLTASATVFSYMGTFVILDTISELFGKKFSAMAINVGISALVVSVLFFQLSIISPSAPFWKGQEAYETTLGSSWRILLGGWTSYMVSQHIDLWSFFKIKNINSGKHGLWTRALGSTVIGQLIDTIIFITIAFYGSFPLLPAIAGQYLLKLGLAIITTPIIYMIVYWGRVLIGREMSSTDVNNIA